MTYFHRARGGHGPLGPPWIRYWFCRLNANKTGVNFDSRFSVVSLLLSGTICYAFLLVFIEIYFKEDCETLLKMYLCIKPSKGWEGWGFRENLLNGCELENGNYCGSEESSERYPDGWYMTRNAPISILISGKKGRRTSSDIFIRKRLYFPTYSDHFRVWVGRRMGIFPEKTASLQTTTAWTGPRNTWYNPSNTLSMDSGAPSTDPTTATATSPSWDQVRTHIDTLLGLDFI